MPLERPADKSAGYILSKAPPAWGFVIVWRIAGEQARTMPGEKESAAGRLRSHVARGFSRPALRGGPPGVLAAACRSRNEPHQQGAGDTSGVQPGRLLA